MGRFALVFLIFFDENGELLFGDVIVFEVCDDMVEVFVDPLLALFDAVYLFFVEAVERGVVRLFYLALDLSAFACPVLDFPAFEFLRQEFVLQLLP
jgi:hypothetical protein